MSKPITRAEAGPWGRVECRVSFNPGMESWMVHTWINGVPQMPSYGIDSEAEALAEADELVAVRAEELFEQAKRVITTADVVARLGYVPTSVPDLAHIVDETNKVWGFNREARIAEATRVVIQIESTRQRLKAVRDTLAHKAAA